MLQNNNFFKIYKIIFNLCSKFELLSYLIIALLTTFLEFLSISLIPPIILSFFDQSQEFVFLNKISIISFDNLSPNYLIIIFVSIYLLKVFLFLLFRFLILNFIHNLKMNLENRLFQNYLNINLLSSKKKAYSERVRNINNEIPLFTKTIENIAVIFIEGLMLTAIILFFVFRYDNLNYIYFTLTLILILSIWIYNNVLKKYLIKLSNLRQELQKKSLEFIQNSFDNIIEIKVLKIEDKISIKFYNTIKYLKKVLFIRSFLSEVPRPAVEVIIIFLFLLSFIFFNKNNFNLENTLTIYAIIFFASIRIIPILSKITQSIQSISYQMPSTDVIYFDLFKNLNPIKNNTHKFKNLKLEKVNFSFGQKEIIKNFSLEINKGDKILIKGYSGSGKSTLLNIILGLYAPNSGKILVNDIDVKDLPLSNYINVGFISQNIFLLNDTIRSNIEFLRKSNKNMFYNSLKLSSLDNIFSNFEISNKKIGQYGNQLSGGQIQRINIARAIFGNPEVLLVDEATSNLDMNNSEKIFNNIINLNCTIIYVTHEKVNEKKFNKIIKLD